MALVALGMATASAHYNYFKAHIRTRYLLVFDFSQSVLLNKLVDNAPITNIASRIEVV